MQSPIELDWVRKYTGIPYLDSGGDGVVATDCWRLLRRVVLERWGIEVPLFGDITYTGRQDINRVGEFIKAREQDMSDWVKLEHESPRAGDIILFRLHGNPLHVGVLVHAKWVLHVEEGVASICERIDDTTWKNRIWARYRHSSLLHNHHC